jgi:hypothetical protein
LAGLKNKKEEFRMSEEKEIVYIEIKNGWWNLTDSDGDLICAAEVKDGMLSEEFALKLVRYADLDYKVYLKRYLPDEQLDCN